MTSWLLMMAPWAFFFGMCLHRRRYLAPRKVWVRPALAAVSPGVPPMQGLPRPAAFFPLRLPADSLTRGGLPGPGGQVPGGREGAHVDADLGDQVLGGGDPEAGDAVQLGDLPLIRLAQPGDLLLQHRDLGGVMVDVPEHHRQDEGVPGGEERAVQASSSPSCGASRPGHLRQPQGCARRR